MDRRVGTCAGGNERGDVLLSVVIREGQVVRAERDRGPGPVGHGPVGDFGEDASVAAVVRPDVPGDRQVGGLLRINLRGDVGTELVELAMVASTRTAPLVPNSLSVYSRTRPPVPHPPHRPSLPL